MSKTPIFSVRAVTVVCSDLERSCEFYESVLGAEPLPSEGACRWYRLGSTEIAFAPNADRDSPASFGNDALTMIWLEVDNLEVADRHFLSHNVEVIQPSVEGPMMIIADPDGLPIMVWQREEDEDSVVE